MKNIKEFSELAEKKILDSLDNLVKEYFDVDKSGWKDEDLKTILPLIEKQAAVLFTRFGDYGCYKSGNYLCRYCCDTGCVICNHEIKH